MNTSYNLKYRTFDKLFSDTAMDLKSYDIQNKIDPAELIKVARKVNYDLGLRINMTKEKILEIEKGKAKVPDDFHIMNFAYICGDFTVVITPPQGTHIVEAAQVPRYQAMGQPDVCVESDTQQVCLSVENNQPNLIQIVNTQTRHYKILYQIRFVDSKFINCDCPNLGHIQSLDEAYFKDGFIWTNFNCANLYINYQGQLEDDNGNLLVLDHPEINEYYEAALKERILQNLIMNGEVIGVPYQLIQQKLREARHYALTIVNTPNFSEMLKLYTANRKAMYSKYYDMFKSWNCPQRTARELRVNNIV